MHLQLADKEDCAAKGSPLRDVSQEKVHGSELCKDNDESSLNREAFLQSCSSMAFRKSSIDCDGQLRIKVRSADNNSYSGGGTAVHNLSLVDSQYNFDDEQQIVTSQSYDDSLQA